MTMYPPHPRLARPESSHHQLSYLQLHYKLCPTPHCDVLSNFLNGIRRDRNAPSLIRDAIIVALDVEWYEKDPNFITELGVAIIDAKDIPRTGRIWDAFTQMRVHHFRIKENAHMLNTKLCPGRPDMFQFGITRFVSMQEAGRALLDCFTWPYGFGRGNRPVVFVGHAVSNDLAMIKKHFGVDIEALGCVVTTVDTQIMAQEAGIKASNGGPLISLKNLLAFFGIHEEFLHTAGNDVAYTLIAGFLTGDERLRRLHRLRSVPNRASVKEAKICVQKVKRLTRIGPHHSAGIQIFCTRCDSTEHLAEQCAVPMYCAWCGLDPLRYEQAYTHSTQKCLEPYELPCAPRFPKEVVVPCLACSNSTDAKRWKKAGTHMDKDCFFLTKNEVVHSAA